MIKNHRPGASQAEISSGSDVRFGEFVSDILDHQREAPNKTVTTVSSCSYTTYCISRFVFYNIIANFYINISN